MTAVESFSVFEVSVCVPAGMVVYRYVFAAVSPSAMPSRFMLIRTAPPKLSLRNTYRLAWPGGGAWNLLAAASASGGAKGTEAHADASTATIKTKDIRLLMMFHPPESKR